MATNKPGRVDSASSGNRPPTGGYKKPAGGNIAGTSYSKENKQGQTSSSNKPVRVDTVSGAASGRDNRPSSSFSSAGSSGKTNSSGKTSSGKSSSGSSGKSSSSLRKNTSSSSRKSASSRKTGTVFDTLASQEKNPKKPPADSVAAAIHKPRFTVNNTQKEDTEKTTSAPQKPNPLTGSYPSASGGSDGENPSANNTYTPPYQAYYEGDRVTGEEYGKLGSQLERVYNPGDKGYYTEGIYRGANGVKFTQEYVDKHPEKTFYPLNWRKNNYQSYIGADGRLYNHSGVAWGDGGIWTADELPDYALAEMHWSHGVEQGDRVPYSEDYINHYRFLNDAYGVAADDTHILSNGLVPGQGYYWKNGGDGITNKPVYTPIGTYTIPGDYSTGGGEMQQMTANLTSKANPNTGMSGGDMMAYYRQAMADAMEEEAAAYERQIDSQVRAMNAQRDPLKQQYNQSAQQAYIQSELAKKNLPQQLAAQGLNGGASESANLAIETGYGNALNQLTQDYNNNLAALDLQIQQLRANGEIAKAQALSQYKQQMAAAYLQQAQQQQSLQNQMALLNYQNQLEQQNKASTSGGYTGPDDDGGSPDIDFSEPAKRIGGGLSNVASAAANLLNPFGYLMGNRSSGESLKNPMGNNKDWIYVAGMGRLTPQEVYNMVQSGQIQEVKNGGTVSYRRA